MTLQAYIRMVSEQQSEEEVLDIERERIERLTANYRRASFSYRNIENIQIIETYCPRTAMAIEAIIVNFWMEEAQ